MSENDGVTQILRALFWCVPCNNGRHDECVAPCGCALHKPSGKVNPALENFGKVGVTFTDEQKEQIARET